MSSTELAWQIVAWYEQENGKPGELSAWLGRSTRWTIADKLPRRCSEEQIDEIFNLAIEIEATYLPTKIVKAQEKFRSRLRLVTNRPRSIDCVWA